MAREIEEAAARAAAHATDEDCEPHLVDDTCTVCGVGRTDACPTCGGLSYHRDDCTSHDAEGGPRPDGTIRVTCAGGSLLGGGGIR